jgi:hypothetical protein
LYPPYIQVLTSLTWSVKLGLRNWSISQPWKFLAYPKAGKLVLPAGVTANLIDYTNESGRTVLAGPGAFHIQPVGK